LLYLVLKINRKTCDKQMSRILKFIQLTAAVALISLPFRSIAETAYVIDQLLVGVHAEKNLESAIIKVLPTGSMLEILERDGELARVKDNTNTEGWIDVAYLMNNPPARIMVERLERANASLQGQLEAAQNSSSTNVQPPAGQRAVSQRPVSDNSALADKLTKENTELKRKLSTELINSTKMTEEMNRYKAQLTGRPLSAAETQVTELEKSVTELNRDLEKSLQANKRLKAENRESIGEILPEVRFDSFSWPIAVALLILIALAYGGGIYTMDYLSRRRHGGFRV